MTSPQSTAVETDLDVISGTRHDIRAHSCPRGVPRDTPTSASVLSPAQDTITGRAAVVPSINDMVVSLEKAVSDLSTAISATAAADSEAEELIGAFNSLGVQDKAEELAAVKSTISEAADLLASGIDKLEEAIGQAGAAGG